MIDAYLNAFEKSDVFTPEEIAKRMVSYLTGEGTRPRNPFCRYNN